MKPIAFIVALVLFSTPPVYAGHGLMSAFGDIQWLPEPGQTPGQIGYTLDIWVEKAQLALASSPNERYTLSLEYAREKLAEVDAMVKQNKPAFTTAATTAYGAYLDAAAQALSEEDDTARSKLAKHFANTLLEHQYIMSVNYLDLPRESRKAIAGVMASASKHYTELSTQLSRAFKASLFFKEEEVRWSWEMAKLADEQGL